MKLRTALIPLTLVLAGAATFPAWSPVAGRDYSSIPPDPDAMFSRLGSLSTNLAGAVKVAEGVTKGHAASVSYSRNTDSFDVYVYAKGALRIVTVASENGRVVSDVHQPRFPGRHVEGDFTRSKTGVRHIDIKVGDGKQPEGRRATVSVRYTGWLVDGTEVEGSTRGKPTTMTLDKFVAGFGEGVLGMRVGGVRKIIVPYERAYGDAGKRGLIPPKAMIIYDVELVR